MYTDQLSVLTRDRQTHSLAIGLKAAPFTGRGLPPVLNARLASFQPIRTFARGVPVITIVGESTHRLRDAVGGVLVHTNRTVHTGLGGRDGMVGDVNDNVGGFDLPKSFLGEPKSRRRGIGWFGGATWCRRNGRL